MICPCCGGQGEYVVGGYPLWLDVRGELNYVPQTTVTCYLCKGDRFVTTEIGQKYIDDKKTEDHWFWFVWIPLVFAIAIVVFIFVLLVT